MFTGLITDVGEVREQREVVDEAASCLSSTLDTEAQQPTLTFRQVALGERVGRMVRQTGIVDPLHFGMFVQILGDCQRVRAVAFHT